MGEFTNDLSGNRKKKKAKLTTEQSLQKAISDAKFRLQNAGVKADADTRGENWYDINGKVEKALNLPKDRGWFFDAMDLLDRPGNAVRTTVHDWQTGKDGDLASTLNSLKRGVAGNTHTTGTQINESLMKNVGEDDLNPYLFAGLNYAKSKGVFDPAKKDDSFGKKFARGAYGLTTEVLLDPLTYVDGIGLATNALKTTGKVASKTAGLIHPALKADGEVGKALINATDNVKDGLGKFFGGRDYVPISAYKTPVYDRDGVLTNQGKLMEEMIKQRKKMEADALVHKEDALNTVVHHAKKTGLDAGDQIGVEMEKNLSPVHNTKDILNQISSGEGFKTNFNENFGADGIVDTVNKNFAQDPNVLKAKSTAQSAIDRLSYQNKQLEQKVGSIDILRAKKNQGTATPEQIHILASYDAKAHQIEKNEQLIDGIEKGIHYTPIPGGDGHTLQTTVPDLLKKHLGLNVDKYIENNLSEELSFDDILKDPQIHHASFDAVTSASSSKERQHIVKEIVEKEFPVINSVYTKSAQNLINTGVTTNPFFKKSDAEMFNQTMKRFFGNDITINNKTGQIKLKNPEDPKWRENLPELGNKPTGSQDVHSFMDELTAAGMPKMSNKDKRAIDLMAAEGNKDNALLRSADDLSLQPKHLSDAESLARKHAEAGNRTNQFLYDSFHHMEGDPNIYQEMPSLTREEIDQINAIDPNILETTDKTIVNPTDGGDMFTRALDKFPLDANGNPTYPKVTDKFESDMFKSNLEGNINEVRADDVGHLNTPENMGKGISERPDFYEYDTIPDEAWRNYHDISQGKQVTDNPKVLKEVHDDYRAFIKKAKNEIIDSEKRIDDVTKRLKDNPEMKGSLESYVHYARKEIENQKDLISDYERELANSQIYHASVKTKNAIDIGQRIKDQAQVVENIYDTAKRERDEVDQLMNDMVKKGIHTDEDEVIFRDYRVFHRDMDRTVRELERIFIDKTTGKATKRMDDSLGEVIDTLYGSTRDGDAVNDLLQRAGYDALTNFSETGTANFVKNKYYPGFPERRVYPLNPHQVKRGEKFLTPSEQSAEDSLKNLYKEQNNFEGKDGKTRNLQEVISDARKGTLLKGDPRELKDIKRNIKKDEMRFERPMRDYIEVDPKKMTDAEKLIKKATDDMVDLNSNVLDMVDKLNAKVPRSMHITVADIRGYMAHILTEEFKKFVGHETVNLSNKPMTSGNHGVISERNYQGKSAKDTNEMLFGENGRVMFDPNAYFATGKGNQRLIDYVTHESFKNQVLDQVGKKWKPGDPVPKDYVVVKSSDFKFSKEGNELNSILPKEGNQFLLYKDSAKMISDYSKSLKEEEVNKFLGAYDKVLGAWKKLSLFSVGFHTGNAIGNNFNMWIAGMSPLDLVHYNAAAVKDVNLAKSLEKKMLENKEAFRYMSKEEQSLVMDYAAFKKQGLKETGQFMQEFNAGNTEKAIRDKVEYEGKGTLGKSLSNIAHPLRSSQKVGATMDELSRYAMYKWGLDKGMGVERAANKVRETLFDYSDLSMFERKVMKRIIPFYTWTRKNAEFQVKNLFSKNSRKYQLVNRMIEEDYRENGIDKENVEDYNLNAPAIPLSSADKNGNAKLLTAGLPLGDLTKLSSPGNLVVDSLSPFIKSPIEQVTNQNMFTGAPIEEYEGQTKPMDLNPFAKGSTEVPAKLQNILTNIGALRNYSNRSTEIEQNGVGQMLGSSLRTKNMDAEKKQLNDLYDEKTRLEGLMKQYKKDHGGKLPATIRELEEMGVFRDGKKRIRHSDNL